MNDKVEDIGKSGARGRKTGKEMPDTQKIIVTPATKRSSRDASGDGKGRTLIIDCKHNRGAR